MDNKSDDQFLVVQAKIHANRQEFDDKMKTHDSKLDNLTEMMENIMDQIQISDYSPDKMHSPKAQDPTTVATDDKKSTPLEYGHSKTIVGMWTLKNEIRSPKFYKLLINKDLKGDTGMYLKTFYTHIKMCLNTVTIILEDLLSD